MNGAKNEWCQMIFLLLFRYNFIFSKIKMKLFFEGDGSFSSYYVLRVFCYNFIFPQIRMKVSFCDGSF